MNKCLYCYAPLEDGSHYHPQCSRKFFGLEVPPRLPYDITELKEVAKKIIQKSIAVPGVQVKLSLQIEKSRQQGNRFTMVGLWGNYILKPAVEKYPELPQNEDLVMHLAELFKIRTVPHALIPLRSGELVYISRRIDRTIKNKKIHMEDLCQLSERLTEDKYKGSMEQVARVIKFYSSNPLLDVLSLFEITLFSFLTGNADMHLKNFSLIYEEGFHMLSPAYDLLSTRLVLSEQDDPEEMALTLNGKKSNIKESDFKLFSENIGLNEKQVNNVFQKFKNILPKALEFIDHSFLSNSKKEEFRELLAIRARRLLL
ncbi:MAG: HipA domain-containing protein [Candidatus Cloacimonetes bacterium]|nr:HipA domain-containing protein [Candidatus Cloacimonadota bacterium]MBL7148957.1 HipA domain-containing protein [Candidatus Cloacimonadota bacterium]